MNTITFWQLLKDNKIVIPIVQRDYAQGRADQVRIRKRFLKSLIMALDGEKDILLDYVFGNQENAVITPLDGQQRLTTLWLLHWYIAGWILYKQIVKCAIPYYDSRMRQECLHLISASLFAAKK